MLRRFNDASGFDAGGANHHFFGLAILHGPHILQIGIETPFIHIMGVAHMVARHRFFSANITYFGHFFDSIQTKIASAPKTLM